MNIKLMHPRDQIVLLMERIYRYGMTTTSGGNLSIVDESGDMWITPAGYDKGAIAAHDIVCIRKNGAIEGIHKASSEYPFHLAIYKRRPDLKAVLHAHPSALVACSVVHQLPKTRLMPQVEYICGKTGYAPYAIPESYYVLRDIPALPYGSQFSDQEGVSDTLSEKVPVVLIENDCLIVTGKNLLQAYDRLEVAEFSASAIIQAKALGSVKCITDKQVAELHATFNF